MFNRSLLKQIIDALDQFPVVALLGCRQVGKTTLALQLAQQQIKPTVYLDLELPTDRNKLVDPQFYLEQQAQKLVILDEIQRVPGLFPIMRGLIDQRRRQGEKTGHFLVLGSASLDLLKQSAETLAGRIAYLEMDPFNLTEVSSANPTSMESVEVMDTLWLRGGFPDSFLASDNKQSFFWREQFIRTYLERDLPQIGPKLSADRVYRLWRMLAFDQGCLLNASRLATSLDMSVTAVRNYLEVLVDLFLIRFLQPWHGNSRKRLIKMPKVYVRDAGIVHALAHLSTLDELLGHSLCGPSWEGFVIEQIWHKKPASAQCTHYRSAAGAEIDLVMEMPDQRVIAVEIKRTLTPKISKGFKLACEEIKPTDRFYLMPKGESYLLDEHTKAINIYAFLEML